MENNTEQNQPISIKTPPSFSKIFKIIILSLVVVILIGTFVLFGFEFYQSKNPVMQNNRVLSQIATTTETTGWQTFTDSQDGFQLQYPSNWQSLNTNGTSGQILDIGYQIASATCAEGVGCTYPEEIYIRGVTDENTLLSANSVPASSLNDFAEQYNVAGLDSGGIVGTPIMIDGHKAIEIDALPNIANTANTGLVPNITFFIQYSQSSVVWIEVNYFSENKDYISKVFKQVISTFKFTN
jgi:hypothetical protein